MQVSHDCCWHDRAPVDVLDRACPFNWVCAQRGLSGRRFDGTARLACGVPAISAFPARPLASILCSSPFSLSRRAADGSCHRSSHPRPPRCTSRAMFALDANIIPHASPPRAPHPLALRLASSAVDGHLAGWAAAMRDAQNTTDATRSRRGHARQSDVHHVPRGRARQYMCAFSVLRAS
jgi:hypothetical protein